MSGPNGLLVEQLPEPLPVGGEFGFSESVNTASSNVLDWARGTLEPVTDIQHHSQAEDAPEPDEPTVAENLLAGLEAAGTLEPEDSDFILRHADKIAQLFESEDEVGMSELSWILMAHETAEGESRDVRRSIIKGDDRTMAAGILAIAEKGQLLTSPEMVQSLIDPIRAYLDTPQDMVSADMGAALVDPESINVLKAMLAIDVATHIQSIPEQALDRTVPLSRVRTAALLMSAVKFFNGETGDKTAQSQLFADEAFEDGIVKDEYREVFDQTATLFRTNAAIAKLEAGQRLIYVTRALHGISQLRRRQTDAGLPDYQELVGSLLTETNTYFHDYPEGMLQKHMLGALTVENWIASVDAVVDGRNGEPRPRPLHEAIGTVIERVKGEVFPGLIQDCQADIDEIHERYAQTSSAMRKIEGGIALREILEGLEQPGSRARIFNANGAQQLAGLSLRGTNHLASDLDRLRSLRQELTTLQEAEPERDNLLETIDNLMMLYDNATPRQLINSELQPVWRLAQELAIYEDTRDATPDSGPVNISTVELSPDITAEDVATELRSAIRDGESRLRPIDWSRISALTGLRQDLRNEGFDVVTHRLQTSWDALPLYALEIPGLGAVIQSFVDGNESYVIPDARWREVIELSEAEAREFGAIPVETTDQSADDHRAELYDHVFSVM